MCVSRVGAGRVSKRHLTGAFLVGVLLLAAAVIVVGLLARRSSSDEAARAAFRDKVQQDMAVLTDGSTGTSELLAVMDPACRNDMTPNEVASALTVVRLAAVSKTSVDAIDVRNFVPARSAEARVRLSMNGQPATPGDRWIHYEFREETWWLACSSS